MKLKPSVSSLNLATRKKAAYKALSVALCVATYERRPGRQPISQGDMMNEMIQRLIERTGLPEDKAMMAADTVIGFLKEKLPGPVGAQIDGLMNGGGSSGNGGSLANKAASVGSNLGGMFGGKQ